MEPIRKSVDEIASELGIDFDAADPAKDLERLICHLVEVRKVELQKSAEEIQIEAQRRVYLAAEQIAERLQGRLTKRHRRILAQIHLGVLVVDDLNGLTSDPHERLDLPDRLLEGLPGQIIRERLIVTVHGMVIRPYLALVLRASVLKHPDGDTTIIHEIMHLLGENNLPMLLNEAATDRYVVTVRRVDHQPESRMTLGYRLAYYCWNTVATVAGTQRVWEAYTDEALVEEVKDQHGHWIKKRLVGHPFHDYMRERMKRPQLWDQFLIHVTKKQMIRAYLIILFGFKNPD
ncbi:hypothetical protein HGA91_00150 [candidate division WWE3 bacterium]|nr:hypothetical protein [candidate division WWE3 bacterium]